MRFEDKVALVTGAASGIGRATALAFAREGAKVVVADVDAEGGAAVAEEVAAAGGVARFVRCDVRRAVQVEGLVRETLDAFGRLDCAFNDAGVLGDLAPLCDVEEDAFEQVVAVNLRGTFLSMKYELKAMLAQGRGSVVNCSSAAGLTGFRDAAVYSATKHGILGLTRSAALECATLGVRVNAVCPGAIDTPMVARVVDGDEEAAHEIAESQPMKRLGRPEEVAAAVLWLSSDAASFVTGHALSVDGGLVAE